MAGAGAQCASPSTTPSVPSSIDRAYRQHAWEEVVQAAAKAPSRTADEQFEYGMALGHLQRWSEARAALAVGRHMCPREERFPLELAGVAFQQKQYPDAATWLRAALKIAPHDAYAANFAGSVYELMGNLPAALKYWNAVQKPYVAAFQFDAQFHVKRLLLERAFVFAPAQTMRLPELMATEVRLRGLGIFPVYSIDLNAQPEGRFDAEFHALEENGFGDGRLQAIAAIFGGLPYETVYPSYYNVRGEAMNVESLLRWDAQKRRLWVSLSAPLRELPQWRWGLATDERDENWAVRRSFTGPAPALGSLHLRREVAAGSVTDFQSGRWQWSMGGEVSRRNFSDIKLGSALTPALVSNGVQAKVKASTDYRLVDLPEHRFEIGTEADSELARIWSNPSRAYGRLRGMGQMQWFPSPVGDTYEIDEKVRVGKIFGSAPFDELFMLGVERDNDLWFRGAIGTRDGQKGSAPMGDGFLLNNSDFYRRVYSNGIFGVKVGPFFDVGRIGTPTSGLAPTKWLVSTGVEAKVTVLGTGVVLTWGRDLRAGTNAFYGTEAK